ncbi:transposase [Aestuariirhabdus sp. LZHN29]|uniref:transposase n=1 Tax=Aestuariirhabdus sp. LZHN29 TaxID=3417462 RepID=UPI003CEE5BDE
MPKTAPCRIRGRIGGSLLPADQAVSRTDKEGNTTASVARELGFSPQQIYNWRRQCYPL